MNGLFDRCMLCGSPTRKPGEPLCIFHDIQAQIALGAERMRARLHMEQGRRVLTNGIKRLSVTAIHTSPGVRCQGNSKTQECK